LEKQGRTKKNGPTQLENRLGFPGELMEFNHSLAGFLFSRFLLVGLFSFLVQKKRKLLFCFGSSYVVDQSWCVGQHQFLSEQQEIS
jgi:hypothetical protein